MNDFALLGLRLAIQRRRKQLTQQNVAAKIGCLPSYISTLELGHYFPNSHTLRKLCLALECSADYLIGLKDEP